LLGAQLIAESVDDEVVKAVLYIRTLKVRLEAEYQKVGHLPLRWDQVDLGRGLLHVRRIKNGTPSVHPIGGGEIRALRRLKREQLESRYVFVTERLGPMTTAGFRKLVARISEEAKFPFPVHPHMFPHACGFKLANDGRDTRALQHYLGHKNIQHTVRYTELSPDRFKSFWQD
jgi:type 1 fimbriae regulatory protein FimB/type 1 fimbriae regulatory protein FimE